METAEDAALTPDGELRLAVEALREAHWRLFRAVYKLEGHGFAPLFDRCAHETDALETKVSRIRREYRKGLKNAQT